MFAIYKAALEDGSDLLVSSPEHKVYSSEINLFSNLSNWFVVNISIDDCSLNAVSSDQIGNLDDKASAKYGSSLGDLCGEILLACDKNSLYVSSDNISKSLFNSKNISLNSDSDIFAKCIILDLLLNSSSNTNFGEIKVHPMLSNSFNTSLLAEDLLKNENNIEASTINSGGSIFYNPCLLATFSFNSSASLDANSSVILLSFNISSNLANLFLLSNLSSKTCLINSDQITQVNLDISDFNSESIANVIDAIYINPLNFNSSNFLSSLIFSDITRRATAATFTSGNSSLNLFNSSSGMDTVILGILLNSNNYFNTSNYVELFKSFSLQPIIEVYAKINNSEEIYLLNAENKPVKAKSITKKNYDGKIYDVYVENYMILVRRNNRITLLLRNSNFGNFIGGLTSGGNLNLSANVNLTMNGGNQIGSNVTCVTIKGSTSILEVC